MRNVVLALLLANSLAAKPAADWDAVKALSPGVTVRVHAAHTIAGPLVSVSEDAVVVHSDSGQRTVTRAEIKRVDLKKRSHRGRNALIGMGVGGGAGLGIGLANRCAGGCFIVGNGAIIGVSVGLGVLVGVGIGAAIPTGGWREVYRRQ